MQLSKEIENKLYRQRLKCDVCGKAIFESSHVAFPICSLCVKDFPTTEYVHDLIN
jgi:RNA polymerase-binding transcription factor DksA